MRNELIFHSREIQCVFQIVQIPNFVIDDYVHACQRLPLVETTSNADETSDVAEQEKVEESKEVEAAQDEKKEEPAEEVKVEENKEEAPAEEAEKKTDEQS